MENIFIQSLVDTLTFVPRILIIMFLSLFISGLLIKLGLFKRLEFIGRPLARLANLPKESALSFIASFGSPVSGNTMLVKLYKQGLIDKRETFLSALLNRVPVYIKETFTYQIPVIIPILGFKIGGIYFLGFLLSGATILLFVILFGKGKLKKSRIGKDSFFDVVPIKQRPDKLFALDFRHQIKTFFKMSSVFVSITFIVFLLMNKGAADRLKDMVQPLTDFFKLPVSAAVGVGSYIFSPLVGATSIGAMARNGSLSDFQAVAACILGSFLMLPVSALRYSLAKYTAIFGFSLGSKILLVSLFLQMMVKGVILLIVLFMI